MSLETLTKIYEQRLNTSLLPVSDKLRWYIESLLSSSKRIDKIAVRAKALDRFIEKALREENGKPKYEDPINQIQDQIGARIVTYYVDDIKVISDKVEKYFKPIEVTNRVPEKDSEFGYFGKHYIFFLPTDTLDEETRENCPNFFELQIQTLFQHAWAEAEHDLGYKPSSDLTSDQRRKIAFTAAQAWGADNIFNELNNELSKSNTKGV